MRDTPAAAETLRLGRIRRGIKHHIRGRNCEISGDDVGDVPVPVRRGLGHTPYRNSALPGDEPMILQRNLGPGPSDVMVRRGFMPDRLHAKAQLTPPTARAVSTVSAA